jgi:hypothetical protein
LAERLHEVHYQNRTLETDLYQFDQQRLREIELALLDEIGSTDLAGNPRATEAFRLRKAQAETNLNTTRPSRLKEQRAELAARRESILRQMAGSPPSAAR